MENNSPLAPVAVSLEPEQTTYGDVHNQIKQLIDAWDREVVPKLEMNRIARYHNVDVKYDRATKTLKSEDDVFVPCRLINSNIERKKPAHLNYLRGPSNLVTFTDMNNPGESFEDVEVAFDNKMKYTNWDAPFVKAIDSALSMGNGAVEVLFDTSAPGKVSVEYISMCDVIFHTDTADIQAQEYVMRRYRWTKVQLRKFAVSFEFDLAVVNDMLAKLKDSTDNTVEVFKVYQRTDAGIQVAWWCALATTSWLKAPLAYATTAPGPETKVPIIILRNNLVEDDKILASEGECKSSYNSQVSASALVSSMVSGTLRASIRRYAVDGPGDTNAEVLFSDKESAISKRPLKQLQSEYPNPQLIAIADKIISLNAQEIGQVNYAVNNREDSRKTATEVQSADTAAAKLTSIAVLNLSNFIREVYTYAWRIMKYAAISGSIKFLPMENGQNDVSRINREFLIVAAGDREQSRRAEMMQNFKELYPLVRGTALGQVMVSDMLRFALPMQGAKYQEIYRKGIAAQDITLELIGSFMQRIAGAAKQVTNPNAPAVVPFTSEEYMQLAKLYAEYQRLYGIPGNDAIGMETASSNQASAPVSPAGSGVIGLQQAVS